MTRVEQAPGKRFTSRFPGACLSLRYTLRCYIDEYHACIIPCYTLQVYIDMGITLEENIIFLQTKSYSDRQR